MRILTVPLQELRRDKIIFIALFQNEPLSKEEFFSYLPPPIQQNLARFVKNEFSGEEGEIKLFWLAPGRSWQNEKNRIVLFGLGEKSKWNERKSVLVPRRMVSYAKREKIKKFTTTLSLAPSLFATNVLLAHFEFVRYKTPPKGGWPEIQEIRLAAEKEKLGEARRGISEGIIIGEEVCAARELVNTPGGDITPVKLAEAASRIAKKNKIQIRVLDEKALERLGARGILGVSRGSSEKPRLIFMEYRGRVAGKKPLVLVGKGVTFDTGGLNLKPDPYMYEMHMDMSGGAAVIHGIAAIARLKLPVNIIGIIPAVENMPSGTSYRPGDILKSLSGKTIEVLNTDAEGRIILADALSYALRFKPGFILDLATLTGAAHVALGNYCSAIFTNRDALVPKFMEIGFHSGDYVWPLPLWEEYFNDIKGTFGDIANTGKTDRYGGAIHGAKFLEQFVENTPWAHLDIAPRMTTVDSDCLSKGASGVGVRYIVELAREYPSLKFQAPSTK